MRPTAPVVVATTMLVLEENVAAPKVLLEAAKLVVESAAVVDVELVPVALVEVPQLKTFFYVSLLSLLFFITQKC